MKVLFQIVGEQGHTTGYLDRLDSGHIVYFIFCATKGCTQKLLFFIYILISRER